ncbi:MAG TPA: hypothetical protein VNQ90_08545 [Chthoniobacteraceae bacterium]|nr:hypothetical protein [Chthoniobacteraceae bacterium]
MKTTPLLLLRGLLMALAMLATAVHGNAGTLIDFTGSASLSAKNALFNQNFYRTYGTSTEFTNRTDAGIRADASLRGIYGFSRTDPEGPYGPANTGYLDESLIVRFVSPGTLSTSSGGIGLYTRIRPEDNLGIYGLVRITGTNSVVMTLRFGADSGENSTTSNTGTVFFNQTLTPTLSLSTGTSYVMRLDQTAGPDPAFTLSLFNESGTLLATSGGIALSSVATPEQVLLYSGPGAIGIHYYAGSHAPRLSQIEIIPEPHLGWLMLGAGAFFLLLHRRRRPMGRRGISDLTGF